MQGGYCICKRPSRGHEDADMLQVYQSSLGCPPKVLSSKPQPPDFSAPNPQKPHTTNSKPPELDRQKARGVTDPLPQPHKAHEPLKNQSLGSGSEGLRVAVKSPCDVPLMYCRCSPKSQHKLIFILILLILLVILIIVLI